MFSKMKLLIKDKMPNIFKFLKNKFGAKKKDLFRDKLGLSVENDETRVLFMKILYYICMVVVKTVDVKQL